MSYTCYGIYFSRTYLVNTVFYRKHNFFNYCDVSSLLKMPLSYIQIWILKQWSVVAFDTFFSLKNSTLKSICFTFSFDRVRIVRSISGKKRNYFWENSFVEIKLPLKWFWSQFDALHQFYLAFLNMYSSFWYNNAQRNRLWNWIILQEKTNIAHTQEDIKKWKENGRMEAKCTSWSSQYHLAVKKRNQIPSPINSTCALS